MFVIIVIAVIIAAFMWLILYGGNANKTDEERFLEDKEQQLIINNENEIYRKITGGINEEYIKSLKNIELTKEQEIAYRKLVEYRLSKEKELYSKDYYKKLLDDYFWLEVALIREDKIVEYVKEFCK